MNLTAKLNNKDVDLADYKLAIDVFDATCESCCLRVIAFLLFLTSDYILLRYHSEFTHVGKHQGGLHEARNQRFAGKADCRG
jgi:hypothetical protein